MENDREADLLEGGKQNDVVIDGQRVTVREGP